MTLRLVEPRLCAHGLEETDGVLGAAVDLGLAIRLDGDRRDLDQLFEDFFEAAAFPVGEPAEGVFREAVVHEISFRRFGRAPILARLRGLPPRYATQRQWTNAAVPASSNAADAIHHARRARGLERKTSSSV